MFDEGLSKDNIELEEIKIVHLIKKKSNFYSIPMSNVINCDALTDSIEGDS